MKENHLNLHHINYYVKIDIFGFQTVKHMPKKFVTSWDILDRWPLLRKKTTCEKDGKTGKLNQCSIWQDKSFIKQDVCAFVTVQKHFPRKQRRVTEPSERLCPARLNQRARGHWIWFDDTVTKWQKPLWRRTELAGRSQKRDAGRSLD